SVEASEIIGGRRIAAKDLEHVARIGSKSAPRAHAKRAGQRQGHWRDVAFSDMNLAVIAGIRAAEGHRENCGRAARVPIRPYYEAEGSGLRLDGAAVVKGADIDGTGEAGGLAHRACV